MTKSTAQQIVDNLEGINSDLSPFLNKTFEHTTYTLTPQEQHVLRENLLHLNAQIKMMALEVDEIDQQRNKRRFNPFKK